MILEWREDVRLGMIRLWSALSRVGGRSPVRGRRLKEGAIFDGCCSLNAESGRGSIDDNIRWVFTQGILGPIC